MTMKNEQEGEKAGGETIDINMTKNLVNIGNPTLGTIEFLNERCHITVEILRGKTI